MEPGVLIQSRCVEFHRIRSEPISISMAVLSFLLRHSHAYPAMRRERPRSRSRARISRRMALKSVKNRRSYPSNFSRIREKFDGYDLRFFTDFSAMRRSEEHTSELQSRENPVC